MAFPSKQYGLLLPQKKGTSNPILQRPSVFGDDSDDETSVGESLQKEAVKKRMMKQTRLEMHKALEQDSTVYDYDAVYEDIQQQRLESSKKVLGGADKKQEQLPQQVIGSEQGHYVESGELDQQQAGVSGSSGKEGVQDGRISVADQKEFWSCFVLPRAPKYINQLMKAVEDRKKEQERRDDRKIQKERETEGEQYADKEAYVTSAYRQKLLERKEELEREKRVAAMEAALDVKKQKDLSGFYRHLLNQTVGEEEIPDRSVEKNQSSKAADVTERTSPLPSPTLPASGDHGPSSHSDSEDGHDQKSAFSKPGAAAIHSKRHYRQRSPASGSGEDEDKERERDREKRSHRDRERDRGRDKNRERERDRQRERDRERDDRHGVRRDDKDRRNERERERDREDDRSRGRKEAEREDRHGRRERSPKERERGKDGEREKRRDSEEDKGKGKESDKGKESRKDLEKEKTTPTDTKKVDLEKEKATPTDTKKIDLEKEKTTQTDTKKIEAAGEGEKKGDEDSVEKGEEDSVEKGEKKGEEDSVVKGEKKGEEDGVEKGEKERVEEEEKVNKFAKRSSDHTVSSARERYLARQMSRAGSKTYIEKEED